LQPVYLAALADNRMYPTGAVRAASWPTLGFGVCLAREFAARRLTQTVGRIKKQATSHGCLFSSH